MLDDGPHAPRCRHCAAQYVAGKRTQTVFDAQDSSRYFVLRIQGEGGRHAFVGLGFTERNHSFDFNVALGEHEKHNRRAERDKKEAARAEASYAAAPKVDMSLKQGETITIALKRTAAGASDGQTKPSWMANAKARGGLVGLKLAAPPAPGAPGAVRTPNPAAAAPVPAPPPGGAPVDPLAALTGVAPPAPAPAPAPAANDPFAALSAASLAPASSASTAAVDPFAVLSQAPAAAPATADPSAAVSGDPFADMSQSSRLGGALAKPAPPKPAPPPSNWAQF